MSFSDLAKENQDIIGAVTKAHQEAASFLPFNAAQIQAAFTEQELTTLAKFVGEMHKATNDNKRSAALINNIDSYAASVVKLLRLARIIA